MSWQPPRIDTTHAIYQGKRPRPISLFKRAQVTAALQRQPGEIVPDPKGSREQKELWMRQRQEEKRSVAKAEAHAAMRRRTRAEVEQEKGVS